MTVLLNMKYELTEEQQKHPIFYALSKMEKRLNKDMAKVPEEKLQEGMRKIALSILGALDDVDPALLQISRKLAVVKEETA